MGNIAKDKTGRVQIKSIDDDRIVIAGYGVVFGGVDLEGETFHSDTDYMLDLVPVKPVMYDHGGNGQVRKSIIGLVAENAAIPDEYGLWVEAELSRHNEYVDAILELIEKGALGWSSGSVGQLSLRDGKSIRRWPIVELSLTPTPAEPRTIGIEQLKGISEGVKELTELVEVLSPEAGEVVAIPATEDIAGFEQSEKGEIVTPEDSATVESAAIPDDGSSTDIARQLQAIALQIELLQLEA